MHTKTSYRNVQKQYKWQHCVPLSSNLRYDHEKTKLLHFYEHSGN